LIVVIAKVHYIQFSLLVHTFSHLGRFGHLQSGQTEPLFIWDQQKNEQKNQQKRKNDYPILKADLKKKYY